MRAGFHLLNGGALWRILVACGFISCGALRVAADEQIVFDYAFNYVEAGWNTGASSGMGWSGGWVLTNTAGKSGLFLATSSGNPRLRLDGYAFGLWANSNTLAQAVRKFATPMAIGDVFRVRWQNLNVSSTYAQSVGVALRDASGNEVIQFYCNGGQGYYRVSDAAAGRLTTLTETDQVIDIRIQLLSSTRYRLTANQMVLEGTYAAAPAQLRVWNWSGRSGSDNDCFFDQPQVIRPATPGTSTVMPQAPQECDEVVIAYDASGGPLAAAENMVLHIGRNGWMNPLDIPMTRLPDGRWQVIRSLPILTRSLEWVFHDGATDEWDNNRMDDWRVDISPCDTAGLLAIDEPLAGSKLPNGSSTIQIRGRSEDIPGDLYWKNETTGQSGTLPAASNWVVDDVALAERTNLFRISGMTSGRTPNAGSFDSASNDTYRNNGWYWRQNAGTGWGEWALVTEGSGGHFIATTSTNLQIGPPAWGVYSGSSGLSRAVRRLKAPLAVGEVVRMKFQNNSISSGGSVGISFRDGRDERLLTFTFVGGNANYSISDDVALRDTGIAWQNKPLDISFELTSSTTYLFTINSTPFTGNLNPTADGQVRIFRIWSDSAGSGTSYNIYLTDLSIEGASRPSRELAARRSIVRIPGPTIHSNMPDADGTMQMEVVETDSTNLYDLYVADDLVSGSWGPAGLEQRGSGESLTFSWTNHPSASFAFVGGRPLRHWTIQNPYRDVDWAEFEQHKALLHCHSVYSDGGSQPSEIIDRYAAMGYSIMTITDHDTMGLNSSTPTSQYSRTTWPWEAFGRVHEAVGVMAIEGNEISRLAHHNSLFNNYGNSHIESERESIEAIGARGGLVFMNHPGKFINGEYPARTVAWYVDIFRDYPHVVGMEAYNQGNRYVGDDANWDNIITQLIAERSVWGFSNDDMHNIFNQSGRNGNIMLVPELTEAWMRKALKDGMFFYFYTPQVNHEGLPKIQSIHVNEADGLITIHASNHQMIKWVSEGRVVHTGDQIALDSIEGIGSYVRAVLYGFDTNNLVGTQPFRIQRNPSE